MTPPVTECARCRGSCSHALLYAYGWQDRVNLVTRGHFRSRDKDGGHTTRSAIAQNPILRANFMAACFLQNRSYCRSKFYIAEFFLLLWPSHTNLTRIPSIYIGCAKVNFVRQGFRKLSYYRKQTDRHDWNNRPRRYACGQKNLLTEFLTLTLILTLTLNWYN